MKIAIITDTHFGARNGIDYFHQQYAKFYSRVFFPTLRERNIHHVLHLGDVFDRRKFIDYVSLSKCKAYFFDPLRENNIEAALIVGNHDIPYRNTLQPNSPELLIAGQYDNVRVISEPTILEYGDARVLAMPWICSDNYERSMHMLKTAHAMGVQYVGGHFEIAGFAMYAGMKVEVVESSPETHSVHDGLHPSIFAGYDLVMSGHFHHRSQRGNIIYVGNPYELTFMDCNDPRGFSILDTETGELEFVQNPYTSFTRIVYNDKNKTDDYAMQLFEKYQELIEDRYVKIVVEAKTDYYNFDTFVKRVEDCKPFDLKIASFESLEIDATMDDHDVKIEDTLTLIDHHVDNNEFGVDKSALKTLMRRLYTQALTANEEQ